MCGRGTIHWLTRSVGSFKLFLLDSFWFRSRIPLYAPPSPWSIKVSSLKDYTKESQAAQCKFVDIGVGVECEEATWIQFQGRDKHQTRCVVFGNGLTLVSGCPSFFFFPPQEVGYRILALALRPHYPHTLCITLNSIFLLPMASLGRVFRRRGKIVQESQPVQIPGLVNFEHGNNQ